MMIVFVTLLLLENNFFYTIIPHFYSYPLITQKLADYRLWRDIILKLDQGEHLREGGIQAIVNLRTSLNRGLSEKLKAAFPKTIPVNKEVVIEQAIPHDLWLAGFTSGEGCFFASIKVNNKKAGYQVVLMFELTQHYRDERLLKSFIDYFGCGKVCQVGKEGVRFKVEKFSYNFNQILPFFLQHKIQGQKYKDFLDLCKIA